MTELFIVRCFIRRRSRRKQGEVIILSFLGRFTNETIQTNFLQVYRCLSVQVRIVSYIG